MAKAIDAFRTISEVAEELDVPKHVLRFWEQRFPQIKPMKRGGGRRFYRPSDVELLKGIRHLLHEQGYTIKGVQKIIRDQGLDAVKTVRAPIAGAARSAKPAGNATAEGAATAAEALAAPAGRKRSSRQKAAVASPSAAVGAGSDPLSDPARRRVVMQIISELERARAFLAPPRAAGPARRKAAG